MNKVVRKAEARTRKRQKLATFLGGASILLAILGPMLMLGYLPLGQMQFPIYRTFLLAFWPVQLMVALSAIGIIFGAMAASQTGDTLGRSGAVLNSLILLVVCLQTLFHVFLPGAR